MSNIDFTIQGISKLLNGLNVHKASGPDLISTRFLKQTADVIQVAPLLQVFFKASQNSGEVQSDWKLPIYHQFLKKVIVVCHKTTGLYRLLLLLVKPFNILYYPI